jgi:hypothetical protein
VEVRLILAPMQRLDDGHLVGSSWIRVVLATSDVLEQAAHSPTGPPCAPAQRVPVARTRVMTSAVGVATLVARTSEPDHHMFVFPRKR